MASKSTSSLFQWTLGASVLVSIFAYALGLPLWGAIAVVVAGAVLAWVLELRVRRIHQRRSVNP